MQERKVQTLYQATISSLNTDRPTARARLAAEAREHKWIDHILAVVGCREEEKLMVLSEHQSEELSALKLNSTTGHLVVSG